MTIYQNHYEVVRGDLSFFKIERHYWLMGNTTKEHKDPYFWFIAEYWETKLSREERSSRCRDVYIPFPLLP